MTQQRKPRRFFSKTRGGHPPVSEEVRAQHFALMAASFTKVQREQSVATSSWWIGKDRETFAATVAVEGRRMQWSKFGRMNLVEME